MEGALAFKSSPAPTLSSTKGKLKTHAQRKENGRLTADSKSTAGKKKEAAAQLKCENKDL